MGDAPSAPSGPETQGDLVHDANGVDRAQIRAALAVLEATLDERTRRR
jgi:hypothetical protein